ncbi:MAG TPA: cyclic nucleotide-binding domain-containing protein [Syntrophorhabdaceae bacterium]|jgi:CRP-like cAMP-binding protein|nr:cyclic nucleotide-binding domain-containing protein [Syntrophorhabdaceae bacterium]HNT68846.1 cyclic nucleotide-binding domain-containing protein [Syntrophorhabdaceae bacterium]
MDVGRSITERAEMLEDTSLSMDFSWKELLDLSYYMGTRRFAKGTVIFKEGDRDIFMSVVAKGEVNILKKDEHMDVKRVTAIGTGKVIGEMSMIDGNPRSATAVAATDTTLVTLSKEGMHQLLKEKPYVGIKMLQKIAFSMSQRLRQTTGILVDYLEKAS